MSDATMQEPPGGWTEDLLNELVPVKYKGETTVTFTSPTYQGALAPGDVIELMRRELLSRGDFDPATEEELVAFQTPPEVETAPEESGSSPQEPSTTEVTPPAEAAPVQPAPEVEQPQTPAAGG